ncbi:hypothetical protein [Paraburkholderia domus]|uniref:hypothetical protein n=1 Tax=Paraburkholderia domus TaxID=2793075 RepID=UPI001912D854|nr:hypothetical protein [Paraburkholderia domus]MBK5049394.1 hypothetical protein [Burkholderia sp. R-70006]MBK5062044.1 hypothetical protein [Burkholderia sp. R-70199]MBK5087297.1 hypothetical protein [Burkholderia sp. R-69927]MBK5124223.1 hypothetical protein [Burkholderia sp. R-69980]MBK5166884.1 hypothetical protein [Burkholderia sp. R-70211]MBK5180769.1 hypothetical protein [Burkholderia sp. R-69749]MCI0148177.1 hypothetical protein [Paraburkholderia sediminicola]
MLRMESLRDLQNARQEISKSEARNPFQQQALQTVAQVRGANMRIRVHGHNRFAGVFR